MNTYLALFLVALCSSLVLTPVVRRLCERLGWLDVPRDGRRVHGRAVPRLGGVAISLSVGLALSTLLFADNLLTQAIRANPQHLLVLFLPSALVLLVGVYDDLFGTCASVKFIALGLAGALLYALGGRIEALSIPFVGSVQLPPLLSFLLTVVWAVGIANAFNLIDGMDGLAAGAALFASLVMLAVALMLGQVLVTVITIAICGALIGFLRYNFNPASIFLGDSGSLSIGFILAALSTQGSTKASTAVAVAIPLTAFGLPVVDTGFTMIRRFISGHPLFEGDREHIHHMLLARGWSQRRAAVVLYGACAVFGIFALLFTRGGGSGHMTALLLVVLGAAVVIAVGHLRYHEVDEVKAGVRRNLTERRLRIANNVRVRRASRAISKARTLGELFAALHEMLGSGEFAYVTVQLGRGGDSAGAARALSRETLTPQLRGAQLRQGLICWEWRRDDIAVPAVMGSSLFWSLRLPLSTGRAGWGFINFYREFGGTGLLLDVNYLSDLLQHELALAAERLLGEGGDESSEYLSPVRVNTGD